MLGIVVYVLHNYSTSWFYEDRRHILTCGLLKKKTIRTDKARRLHEWEIDRNSHSTGDVLSGRPDDEIERGNTYTNPLNAEKKRIETV